MTACPVGAIDNPAVNPAGVEAQVRALVTDPASPAAVAFRCSRGRSAAPSPGWFDVVVACAGMVPVHWMFAALLLGAQRVAVVPCSESGCPLGNDERLLERLRLARRLAAELGLDDRLLGSEPGAALSSVVRVPVAVDSPFEPAAAARVFMALSAATGEQPDPIWDASSPCGVVRIDPTACTMCSMCSRICPTDALSERGSNGTVEIVFDPIRCVACSQCVAVCPEGDRDAITVDAMVDFEKLEQGVHVVNTTEVPNCVVCGGPVAPEAMLARIGALLGDDHATTYAYLRERCRACRAL